MNMTFIPAHAPEEPAKYLARAIATRLKAGQRVLWLVSGGSCIDVAVATAKLLASEKLVNLTVSLIDERYGEPGHANSNWHQLETAGFALPGAVLHPVLAGQDQVSAAVTFAEFLKTQIEQADYRIGLLGMGTDGHTSGILPHSPAVTASGLVCDYTGPDFARITTTPAALARLSEAVLYATGQTKWPMLDRLETELPLAEQPAQALKTVPRLTIFTDRPLST